MLNLFNSLLNLFMPVKSPEGLVLATTPSSASGIK
jgi:hypothetical protein